MHVQYEMIPCSGFIEEVHRRQRRTNSARMSHPPSRPPSFRRVTNKVINKQVYIQAQPVKDDWFEFSLDFHFP